MPVEEDSLLHRVPLASSCLDRQVNMSPWVGVVGGVAGKDLGKCHYVGGQAREGDE